MVESGRRAPGIGQEGRPRPQPKHTTLQQQQSARPDTRNAQSSKHIMCRQIEAVGKCSWGDRCWFAHDAAEQEQGKRQRQPGYKGSIQKPKHEQRQEALMNWPSEREKLFSAEEQATFGRKPQSSLKHQLCPHLPHGRCTHGDSCWYSHSLQEQRAALEKRKSIAAARNNVDDGPTAQPGPQKDQLCVKFGKGLCTRGDKCWFSHSLAEQRDAMKQQQEQDGTSKADEQQQAKVQVPAEQSRKHLPCQILKSGKACTLGARCPFAHGEHERRLALEALQERNGQPEPSDDAPVMQQDRSKAAPAEPADRPQSNGSSSPDATVACLDPNSGEEASSRKQTICTALRQGHCPAGDRCRFSHSQQERLHTMVGASTATQIREISGTFNDKLASAAPEGSHQASNTLHIMESSRPVQGFQTGPAATTADQLSSSSLARPRRAPGSGMRAWPETGQHAPHEADHPPGTTLDKPNDAYKPSATGAHSLSEHSKTSGTARGRPSGVPSGRDREQHRWEHAAAQQQQDIHALPGPSKKHVPCLMFAKHGHCPRGAICWFAHGPDELQAAHIQQLESKQLQSKISKRDVDATGLRLCMYFRQGRCERGIACSFSHATPASSPDRRPALQANNHHPLQPAEKQPKPSPDSTLSGVDEQRPATISRSSSPHRVSEAVGHEHSTQAPLDAWNTAIEDAVNSTGQGTTQQHGIPTSEDLQADEWSAVLEGIIGEASVADGASQQQVKPGAESGQQEAWSRAIESAVSNADVPPPSMQDTQSSSISDQTGDMGGTATNAVAGLADAASSADSRHAVPEAQQQSAAGSQNGQQDTANSIFLDALANSTNAAPVDVMTDLSDPQQQQIQFQPERPDQDAWAAAIDDALLSADTSMNQVPPQFGTFTSSPSDADLVGPSPAWHPKSQALHQQSMEHQKSNGVHSDPIESDADGQPPSDAPASSSATSPDPAISSAASKEETHSRIVNDSAAAAGLPQQQSPDQFASSQLPKEAASSSQKGPVDGPPAGASGRPVLEGFDNGLPAEFHLPAETISATTGERDAAYSSTQMAPGAASPGDAADTPTPTSAGQQETPAHGGTAAAHAAAVATTDAASAVSTSGAAAGDAAAAEETSGQPTPVKGPVDADDLEALELDKEASKYAPALLRCPLTKEVFRNPVIAKDGRTFERSALLAWWSNHETYPYSSKTAYDRSLVPNAALRAAINALYGVVPVRPQPVGMR